MSCLYSVKGFDRCFRSLACGVLAAVVAVVMFCSDAQAFTGLTINATFGAGFTSPEETAINAAVTTLEQDITNPITVAINFQTMTTGLGQSSSYYYTPTYYQYYNALELQATAPGASLTLQTAFASLAMNGGVVPTGSSSPNPATGSNQIDISGPQGRMLGLGTSPPPGQYDTVISLNTSITSPPNGLPGNYGLQSVAQHELDEALGIGGPGSTIDTGNTGSPSKYAAGVLDLYRYSAPGVRSWSSVQTTSPYAYFSINGGASVVSYFNQTQGADYADWLSNPIPAGFGPQVQDAYGQPGTNPALGPNELTAFQAIGYSLTGTVPEPSTLTMLGTAVLFVSGYGWSRRKQRAGQTAA